MTSDKGRSKENFDELYADTLHYHVNTGDEVIHAKRLPGRFRNLKWLTMSTWIFFFIGPYLQWNGHQALLFDIPGRKFYLFGATIWPQDIWMLSLLLILLAMTLFGVTAVAGRVFCGYFCFQTVWTDIFTWIEDRIEGNPIQRRKLDAAPWSGGKIAKKTAKHILWLLISILTGITFAAYFTDAIELWQGYLTLSAPLVAWVVLALFIGGTYILAGFMREQVCFWLCPYARIQSVMVDKDTIMPTYDFRRGEPRGKVKARGEDGETARGDCIDCKMCVGVCPTGVDIREGMSEGCIMCGLCIDACDSIMDKVDKPRGLIRYLSQKEMEGEVLAPLYRRPRVITYTTIFLLAITGIAYGLATIPPIELSVVHSRQPLFTRMSDGSIQNKYTIKAVNKAEIDQRVSLTVTSDSDIHMVDAEQFKDVTLKAGKMVPFNIFLRAMPADLKQENTDVQLLIRGITHPEITVTYESVFIGPKK